MLLGLFGLIFTKSVTGGSGTEVAPPKRALESANFRAAWRFTYNTFSVAG